MTLVPVTPPEAEPLSLEEAKLHLRVDGTDEDSLISALISTARMAAEGKTGRSLMPQTWKLLLSGFPPGDRRIMLPRPPFRSVTSVAYIAADGTAQTMDSEAYRTGEEGLLTALRPAWDTLWPATRDGVNTVTVTYQAGYENASKVPEAIKAWIKIMIGTLFDNREAVLRGQTATASFLPRGFSDGLLDPFVIPAVA